MVLPVDHLTRFLAAAAKLLPEPASGRRDVRPFITISRQAGAGGAAVAQAILDQMRLTRPHALFNGWRLLHDRLAELVAENPSLKVSLRGLAEEEFATGIQDMVSTWIAGLSAQSAVVAHLFKVIRSLAAGGKVIIVGRAGVCLTRHLPGGLHLRLVSSLPTRVRRVMEAKSLTEKDARRVIRDRDRARASLVKNYFHREIDDPLLYDMVWNTEALAPKMIAATTLRGVEALLRHGRQSGGVCPK